MAFYIPADLEGNFLLRSNDEDGCRIEDALSFSMNSVSNLYTWNSDSNTFTFSFQEKGIPYGESTTSECLVEASFHCGLNANFKLSFEATDSCQWGINFVGQVIVSHADGTQCRIYLPGVRTYDPAGKSGDPHASERIGPSCFRTQTAITVAQLVAAHHGASIDSLKEMQCKLRHMISKYHGREVLFDWMFLQIQESIYKKRHVTPYPEFIKSLMACNRLILDDTRDHTRSYLASYNINKPEPPLQYYKKVAAKDKVEDLLDTETLARFKKIIN